MKKDKVTYLRYKSKDWYDDVTSCHVNCELTVEFLSTSLDTAKHGLEAWYAKVRIGAKMAAYSLKTQETI
jgi:hypothetical protein